MKKPTKSKRRRQPRKPRSSRKRSRRPSGQVLEGALTSLSEGLGLKKSAVSSAFRRASKKDLDALNGRSLSEWNFAALYIDGTSFADHTCIVALGIEKDGTKRILGVREGATENAEPCVTSWRTSWNEDCC